MSLLSFKRWIAKKTLGNYTFRFFYSGLIQFFQVLCLPWHWFHFIRDTVHYQSKLEGNTPFKVHALDLYPCFLDKYQAAGQASGHYFHQDIFMAQQIYKANPGEHWDIGSRIDGFISNLLTFRKVNIIDIRALESKVPEMMFHQGDVTCLNYPDNYFESLSCLHAMEHVGLGRYGDTIDPEGCYKGMTELSRTLKPGGTLYFSVPIGKERVVFNAHRVFNPKTIIERFAALDLVYFAAVNDEGNMVNPAHWQNFVDSQYSCGLFIYKKPDIKKEP